MLNVIKQWFKRMVCKVRGHDYPCHAFHGNALCFCQRCGKEVLDRTFEDLQPVSDEEREMWMRFDD